MLARRIIPCIEIHAGQVVKGAHFATAGHSESPAHVATAYELQGADEVILVDDSASSEDRAGQLNAVRIIRERISIPLTVGGGVRSVDAAGALLDAGADKVLINSAAMEDPSLIDMLAAQYGFACIVLALDAAQCGYRASRVGAARDTESRDPPTAEGESRCWEVVVHSGNRRVHIDAIDWAREAGGRGAGEILLTSLDRDGTRSGYDLELIAAMSRGVLLPIIASGGAASPLHLVQALKAGADAVLTASIPHDGDLTLEDVKRYLASEGLEIRR